VKDYGVIEGVGFGSPGGHGPSPIWVLPPENVLHKNGKNRPPPQQLAVADCTR